MTDVHDEAPGSDDLLAAEQALGVLDAADRAEVERRLREEPAFAAAVEDWTLRLAKVADEAPMHAPPPGVWARIVSRLGADVVEFRLRRSLAVWRAATGMAAALAACLAAALVWPHHNHIQTARLTGDQNGRYVYVVVYDAALGRAVFTAADQTGVAGRTPQLWVLPPGAKPVSLGIAPAGGVTSLPIARQLSGPGRTLAVSLEPSGGSPTGQPTGPVVATGALTPI